MKMMARARFAVVTTAHAIYATVTQSAILAELIAATPYAMMMAFQQAK